MMPKSRLLFLSLIFSLVLIPSTLWSQNEDALELRVRGYHAQQRGSTQEAIDFYNKAIAADAAYATPHNDLGILYEDQGNLKKAEEEYRIAIQLDDNYAGAHTNLASLYDRQGRYAEALPIWRRRAELGGSEDRWRRQAEERVAELQTLTASPVLGGFAIAEEEATDTPYEETVEEAAPQVETSETQMAEQIAGILAEEAQTGALPAAAPAGFTTVRLASDTPAATVPARKDWYEPTGEAQSDRAYNAEEVTKMGPEAKAKYLLARAKVDIANDNYQHAVELLREARLLDPDELEIDKTYWEAREKQIEEDIVRSSIDSSVYNRRKIVEVEKKWFPPTPENVPPFDKSKYIVQGSEKSTERLELERKAKQIVPTIDFTDAQLKNVIEYLATSNDINIVIDEAAAAPSDRVTVHLKNIPLDEALDIILRTKGLKYRLEENIIWITSVERLLEEDLEVRVYDVQDLVGKLYDFPSEPFNFEKFIDTKDKAVKT